jgi:hypothetical protein
VKAEPVGIGDAAFLIMHAVKDCPAKTVIRELIQNALEADDGEGWIEWFVFDWNGTRKLGLYNEGPGMTADQLKERMKIASTGKELGFAKNFGQGAKLSAAKSSPHGFIIRSCHDGIVSEIWLQVREDSGGRKELVIVPQYDEFEHEEFSVRQVTDDAAERGRLLDYDWTEAILLGRSDTDDTTTGKFLIPDCSSVNWLMQEINQRYYVLPPGIDIRSATIPTHRVKQRNARGLRRSLVDDDCNRTARKEDVASCHPELGNLVIRYGKLAGDPKERRGGPLHADGIPGGTHVCLVYKDEIYDFDAKWTVRAGAYGFGGIADDYYVHILIPDDAPVKNNTYRTDIVYDDNDVDVVTCQSLCELVKDGRPQWILDDIAARNTVKSNERLRERVQKLAEKLKARLAVDVVAPGQENDSGVIEMDHGDGTGGPGPANPRTPTEGGRYTERSRGKRIPRPNFSSVDAQFQPRDQMLWYDDFAGRAGQYCKHDNTIRLSVDFEDYLRLQAWVNQLWPESDVNGKALAILDEEYQYHAIVFGMSALSFRGVKYWTPDQWERALEPEALTAHMRDPRGVIEASVKNRMGNYSGSSNQRIRNRTELSNA